MPGLNYIDIYFKRKDYLGSNPHDRAEQSGQREFQSYLKNSPNAVELSTNKYYFTGIILSNKQDPNRLTKKLEVELKIPIHPGVIVNWGPEKWIVIQQERKALQSFNTFIIIRCNYLIKWVDAEGFVQSTWSYIVSSMDSKIKENFRTWNNLITPQPNKYAEVLIPTQLIERYTRFIIMQESWYVIEIDKTSVPGLIYMSLGEEKVNAITDDTINEIAETDKIAKFAIEIPSSPIKVKPNSIITPIYSTYKNGIIKDIPVSFSVSGNLTIQKDGTIKSGASGSGQITITLNNGGDAVAVEQVQITNSKNSSAIVSGDDSIKLDRISTYYLEGVDVLSNVFCSIDDISLAYIVDVDLEKCVIKANNNNKLGEITLTVEYNGESYYKTIKIVPLW